MSPEPTSTRTERGWRYTFGPGALRDVVVSVSGQAEIVHPDGTIDTVPVDGHKSVYDERSGDNTTRRVMARIGRPYNKPTPLTIAMRAFRGDTETALSLARGLISNSVAMQLAPARLSDEPEPELDLGEGHPDDPF